MDEDIIGNVTDLPAEYKSTNQQGEATRTVRHEETGNLITLQIGPDGNILKMKSRRQ